MTTATKPTANLVIEGDTERLLKHLWRGGAYGFYWTNDPRRSLWVKPAKLPAIPKGWARKNVYFGLHPCREIPPTNSKGEATDKAFVRSQVEYLAALNCFYADFDAKGWEGGKDAILAHLEENLERYRRNEEKNPGFPFPSAIVDSGGGFHCYWLLEHTVTVTDDNRDALKRLQVAWVELVGADPDAKDLARVLRIPGTLNMKSDYGPNFPQVHFVEAKLDRFYRLEDFEALTEHLRADPAPTTTERATHRAYTFTDDLTRAAENLKRLHPGRADDYQEWVNVGMALSELGDAGLQLWDEWSQQSSKHKPGVCAGKWKTFTPAEGLGLGSLTHWADEDDPGGRRVHTNGTGPGYDGYGPVPGGERPSGGGAGRGFDVYDFKAEDGGILDCWLEYYGVEWMHVHGLSWMCWAENHWSKEDTAIFAQIQRLMRELNDQATEYLEDAFEIEDKDAKSYEIAKANAYIAATKRTANRVSSVERMAQAQRAVKIDQLDGGGNLLNFPNCTYNLDTYEVRPHERSDFITHVLPYDYNPEATCPRWEQFLCEVLVQEETTEPDNELIALFQEFAGYALTSETQREVMLWLHGTGGNGKTIAIRIIESLLGPLAMSVNFHTLGDPRNYTLAELPGKRLIFSSEGEKNKGITEGLVKQIVSGETIQARAIRAAPFEFQPVAKILWASNNPPLIKDTTDAIWRRLRLIPFHRKFTDEQKDVNLFQKLQDELPGILNWAIQGLDRLRQNGHFTQSAAAQAAADDLRLKTNPVAQWLQECTQPAPVLATKASEAFGSYKLWCEANGRQHFNATNFGHEISLLDVRKGKSGGYVRYAIELLPDYEV